MISKKSSIEEKVKLPPTETISRSYHPQKNKKGIRILTVAIYVLCVSLSAIVLSLYYIFIWDPHTLNNSSKLINCEKIIIPEQIAIKLINSSEITADEFYKRILHYHATHKKYIKLNRNAYNNPIQKIIEKSKEDRNIFVFNDNHKYLIKNINKNNNNGNPSTTTNQNYPIVDVKSNIELTSTTLPILEKILIKSASQEYSKNLQNDDEDYNGFIESSGFSNIHIN